jgi:ATP-dependent dihydroxyacetone kinase
MKKLINNPQRVVREMLEGLAALRGDVALLSAHDVLLRGDADKVRDRQVALISGGGSGHEPAHAGYVGAGLLSAAVAGQVFSSPSPDAVLAAIRAVAGVPGVLLVVKNYTGDRLNFGLAAEMARAEGIAVEMVVVADDIALSGVQDYAGARGIAGTVLVHKIAGAAAAEGKSLQDVAAAARDAAESVATLGIALSAGILPASGKPTYELGDEEIELGLGIHGEPGIQRTALRPANELAKELVERIVLAQHLRSGEAVALLVNNLGSTTEMELAVFARAALNQLASLDMRVERVYAGPFMTSLDAAGVSLSTMRLNAERLRRLDAAVSAPAWPRGVNRRPQLVVLESAADVIEPRPELGASTASHPRLREAIAAACAAIEQAEVELTELDQAVGDADLGTNLARGARQVRNALSAWEGLSPAEILKAVGLTLQTVVGGSSGALYGILFLRAANSMVGSTDVAGWSAAVVSACRGLSQVGQAKAGDRTMIDALWPFAVTFDEELKTRRPVNEALKKAAAQAEEGAAATANIIAKRGRSSYLGQRVLGHPDPGAVAVAIWLRAVVRTLTVDGPE